MKVDPRWRLQESRGVLELAEQRRKHVTHERPSISAHRFYVSPPLPFPFGSISERRSSGADPRERVWRWWLTSRRRERGEGTYWRSFQLMNERSVVVPERSRARMVEGAGAVSMLDAQPPTRHLPAMRLILHEAGTRTSHPMSEHHQRPILPVLLK